MPKLRSKLQRPKLRRHVTRKRVQALVSLSLFIVVSIALASTSSENLIEIVGSDNAFIIMFVLGMVGGLTTFTGIPYHLVLMNFAAGGVNPVLLGTTTALGVMLGDSVMFVIGRRVRAVIPDTIGRFVAKIDAFFKKHPRFLTPMLVAYGAFSPFSNDFIVASLSMTNRTYAQIIAPLTLGNIIYNIMIAYAGIHIYAAI